MKEIKVLLIGGGDDNHLIRFLTNLREKMPEVRIDFFNYECYKNVKCKNLCENVYAPSSFFQSLFFQYIDRTLYKIFRLRIFAYISYWLGFSRIKQQYDIVNVHYVMPELLWSIKNIKKKCGKFVLTPWGSDVLRQNEKQLKILKQIYKHADYVTTPLIGFRTRVKELFDISEEKFYDTAFGSEMIDLIAANENLTKQEAKGKLGVEGKFIITVGYNANPAHHHIEIIEQIIKVREKLPKNLFIILPMSYYVTSKQHIVDVKELLRKNELEYYCFENYVTNNELLLIRKCSDVFIHAQTTDAANASLTEYLLTDNIVLNASWLDYPQLEKFGLPYYKFDKLEEIGIVLVNALSSEKSRVSIELKNYIKTLGWDSCSEKWAGFYRKIANV